MSKESQTKYVIRTNSKLLVEFAQTPEGMAKIILMVTIPFWAISILIRKLLEDM